MADFNRCLVTGATGFVGSHLAHRLVRDGTEVHVLVRNQCSTTAVADILDKVTVHQIGSDTDSVINALESAKPDVVFHLAAMFKAEHLPNDIQPLIDSNITFTAQLLEAMKLTGAGALINTGTGWQHYHNADYDPVCLYAATKQAAEDIITFYCNAHGLRSITLKLFDTYGPSDPRVKLFYLLSAAAKTGKPLDMSAGEQLIDLVHIDDVTAAYVIAAQRLLSGKVLRHERYAVSSGNPLPLKDLVQFYAEVTDQHIPVNWGVRQYRDREVMVPWTRGSPIGGWTPRISLQAGIASLLL